MKVFLFHAVQRLAEQLVNHLRVALALGGLHALTNQEANGILLALLIVCNRLRIGSENLINQLLNCTLIGYLLQTQLVNDGVNRIIGLKQLN